MAKPIIQVSLLKNNSILFITDKGDQKGRLCYVLSKRFNPFKEPRP